MAAPPYDWRLLACRRAQLVKAARENALSLCQNYLCENQHLRSQVGHFAHFRKFKRTPGVLRNSLDKLMKKAQLAQESSVQLPTLVKPMARIKRILTQLTRDKKSAALHAPNAKCIAKGKAKTPYKFCLRMSTVSRLKEKVMVKARLRTGNSFCANTLLLNGEKFQRFFDKRY